MPLVRICLLCSDERRTAEFAVCIGSSVELE
jgi:hypothetical protein